MQTGSNVEDKIRLVIIAHNGSFRGKEIERSSFSSCKQYFFFNKNNCLSFQSSSHHHKWGWFILKYKFINKKCFLFWQMRRGFLLFWGFVFCFRVCFGKSSMTSWYHSNMGRRSSWTSLIPASLVLYPPSFLHFIIFRDTECQIPISLTWIDSRGSSTATQRIT